MKRTLAAAAAACGGRLEGGDGSFGAVSIDSRMLARGDLFVALKGERVDGHDFLDAAARAGAAGALVQRLMKSPPHPGPLLPAEGEGAGALAQILVADTLSGLTALARSWRD